MKNQTSFPLLTCTLTLTLLTTTYINIYHDDWANKHLQCSIVPILKQYQIWRPTSNVLNEPSLTVMVLFLIFAFKPLAKFERKNGTVVLFVTFLVYNGFFNGIVLVIEFVLWMLSLDEEYPIKTGILCVWLNSLYKFCYFNRNSNISWLIPTIYLPVIIVSVVMIVDGNVRVDGLIGLVSAMLSTKFLRGGGLIGFTKQSYTQKQQKADCIRLSSLPCWCRITPENFIINDLAVMDEYQFYQGLDPENPTTFQEYQLGQAREDTIMREMKDEQL